MMRIRILFFVKTIVLASAFISTYSFGEDSLPSQQEDAAFDADFLRKDSQDIPQQFYHPEQTEPGIKTADIILNDRTLFKTKIEFVKTHGEQGAIPCLTQALLHQIGLDHHLDELQSTSQQTCYDLTSKWPDAKIHYDESMQQLIINAPQAAMNVASQREMIDPSLWDSGVNALRLSYSGYVYHTQTHNSGASSDSSDSAYLSLNSGVNL